MKTYGALCVLFVVFEGSENGLFPGLSGGAALGSGPSTLRFRRAACMLYHLFRASLRVASLQRRPAEGFSVTESVAFRLGRGR